MNQIAVAKPTRQQLTQQQAGPSEPELTQRDIDFLIEASNALIRADGTGDLDQMRRAIGYADTIADDNGLADTAKQIEALQRQATRRQIGEHVAVLIAAFPNAGKLDPAFSRILCEDIAAMEPTIGALDFALRRLRRESKFIPVVAEVMDALAAAERRITSAASCLERLPARVVTVRQQLSLWQGRYEAAALRGSAGT